MAVLMLLCVLSWPDLQYLCCAVRHRRRCRLQDRSGEIDKYELRTLCRELGIGMNVKQLKQAWGWMDKDGDGTIQLEEFDTWLFGDKSQDTTFGDTTGARVDVQLFDQFVNGLGIKDLVAEAAEMAEVAKQAADVAVAAAEEADGVEGKEAAWLELKRKEETLAAKGRERDEKRRLAQEDREQAQAALGGAAGAGAVSKLFGGGATGLSRSSALGQKAARQHHAAAAKAEYEMRLKALEGRQHAELIAPPQPLRLVRRAAMPDPNKPHVRKKRLTAPAEPDNGDGDRWLDQNGIPRQFRPTGPELLRSKDWHRHRELVGPRHLWRFVDSSVVYADEQSGTEYEDVSFEQLVPDMEVEVFWEEDQRYHKAVVQHTLCQKRFASANPSEWKNKLLLYPEFMTSGLEFEVLTGPVGMFGVVIGRRKHEPARSLEDGSQPLALTDDTRLASPQDEKQSETVMLDAVLTGAEATGRLTSDQVRLMRRNVEVGRFPATYYLVRLQDTYLAYTGEEQQWTVPATGWYDLEVVGAGGGAGYFQPGGRGARLRATFMLQGGEALYVLVGGASMRVRDCSGGGGGTFVALNDRKKPLMVAGGGGGTRGGRGDQPGGDASLSTNGGDGVGTFWAAGGKDGHGGHNAPIGHGNGGGGFLSGGNSEVEVHGPGPGRSFQDGGGCVYEAYEDGSTNLVGSGFGGGGGHGTQGGGGGGGYSGGGGGEGGGGGGSFVRLTAENVEKIHAVAPGRHGYVKVSWSLLQNGDTGHAEAAGKPMSFKVARFGPKDFEVRKKAVRCEPQMADHIDGCTNIEELGGKIGVVRRGGCSFVLKAQRLQAAGCVAVVVEFNAGEALEQLGDPKGMAKDVTVPVVSMHAEDMTTVLAAEDLLIKHGDKPADAWDDFAAAAKKKGHAAMMEKLLSNADNHGAYNREQTANRLKHKARIGMIMGANERKLTKAQQIMADGLQLELQRSRARPKHNPKALMDYVYDTWGARVRDGNLSRASKASYRPTMTDSDGAPITNNTPPESDVILGLFKQNVTDAQAEKLAELMPLSHNLRIVYLGKNRIGDAGCEALAEAIPLCHKLELISLKGNAFAEAGKTALRRALAHPYSTPGLRIDGAELGRGKLDIGKFRAKRAAAGGLGGEGANAKDWRGKSRTTTYKGGISSGGLARVSVGAIDQLGDLQLRQAETTSGGRYQHGT